MNNAEAEPISTTSDEPEWEAIAEEVSPELHHSGGDTGPDNSGLLTKDEFYQAVKTLFDLPNIFLPVPIKSLPIHEAEEPQARAATDAFYDVALKSPWLRKLLEPGAEWLQPLLAIGTFVVGKIVAVNAELRGRVAANDNAATPKAANDNAPGAQAAGLGPFAHDR